MRDPDRADIAIVGAGAAGLMAGICAGREARRLGRPARIVALDGANKIGVKILVAGGGRCNVTHQEVGVVNHFVGSRREVTARAARRFAQLHTTPRAAP